MTAETLAIALALFSAVTVAITNFTVKRGGDVLTARAVMSATMAACALPFAFFVPIPPVELWPRVALALAIHGAYQFCMIKALHRGDLSLVFPVMRGLAPLVVGVLAFFALDETLAPLALIGLGLSTLALIVFALPEDVDAATRSLNREAMFWAVLTAIGVGAYTVSDASVIRDMPVRESYIVWLFLLDGIPVMIAVWWTRRGAILAHVRPQFKASVIGGVSGFLSFSALLYALSITQSSALVTALRETSVLFAAVLGAVFLKEGFGLRRSVSAGVLALGLILMQIGGSA